MSHAPAARVRPRSCGTCPLHRSFCDFPEELRAAFDGLKTTIAVSRNETIFEERTRCHSVFAVCEGNVKLVTSSTEGRVLLLRVAGPGEMLALAEAVSDAMPYQCSAIAMEPTILASIPRETFIRFVNSYPQACVALAVALSEQYRCAQEEEKFLAFGETSTVRLARLLLGWSEDRGEPARDGVSIPVHLTHTELAQAIGSTRETVTRVLGSLSDRGLVERQSSGLVVVQPDALARIASSSPKVTARRDRDAFTRRKRDLSMVQEITAPGGPS
jgi:CRP/FNR family cyclic AMP-dependent transcriptional regulator